MQKELHDTYRGRKIGLSVQGYGASMHTQIRINDLDVSSKVLTPDVGANSADLGVVIVKVRRMIDEDRL